MIASDVTFIMNGANHLLDSVSTYSFAIFGEGWEKAMEGKSYPSKGNTVLGNDVWFGYWATLMSGVKIGDGAIIASHSLVTQDVAPYAIVGGSPAQEICQRFSDQDIETLLEVAWWNWEPEKITPHLSLLTGHDIQALKELI